MNDFFGSPIRRQILSILIIGFIAVVVFRLFNMQVLEQYIYEEKSDENSVKRIVRNAPRGIFYDRNFNVLVSNKPTYALQITPDQYDRNLDSTIETALGADSGYVGKILHENRRFSRYQPRTILRDIPYDVVAWVEENHEDLPGVEYVVEMQRDYSFGINGAHMFGYTKEIDQQQYQKQKDIYDMGDIVGYNGIERTYEPYLRGEKGSKFILVDSKQKTIGRYRGGLGDIDPEKGYDLVLTIDKELQKIAENFFKGKSGALVAMDPKTGEILAFVSAPTFDLSDFAAVTSEDEWKRLRYDPEKPLFNRATMSINPPGSTFKMLAALAGLEEGVINENTRIICPGGYQFGNRFFKCLHVHGSTGVVKSIEKSCNTFYYQLILKLGLDRWARYGHMFGFGEKTGIDIVEEVKGIVPDTEYYNRVYGKNGWTQGYLISLGIGQGELSATPIQLAQYVSLIANYGKTKTPHLVKGLISSENNQYIPLEFDDVEAPLKKETFDIVRKGMYNVVQGTGTAWFIRLPDIEMAGKTGTAQNPHGEDHAQFVAFAPFDDPKIAIAVIVENVGYGSTHAAPVARDLVKAYLSKEEPKKQAPQPKVEEELAAEEVSNENEN